MGGAWMMEVANFWGDVAWAEMQLWLLHFSPPTRLHQHHHTKSSNGFHTCLQSHKNLWRCKILYVFLLSFTVGLWFIFDALAFSFQIRCEQSSHRRDIIPFKMGSFFELCFCKRARSVRALWGRQVILKHRTWGGILMEDLVFIWPKRMTTRGWYEKSC